MSNDVAVELIRAVVDHQRGLHDAWESFAVVVELSGGRVRGTSGFGYGPGEVVSAIAARPSGVQPAVQDYLASYFGDGDEPPVKLLVQFDRTQGAYEVTFEDTDTERWKVTPANLDATREELRPRFEA